MILPPEDNLMDWEMPTPGDYYNWQRLDKKTGEVVAEITPNPNPFTKKGQAWGFLWKTPNQEGPERSPASAQAWADRQLRIDGYLPVLEVKDITIPSCGHLVCAHGFMGCIVEKRFEMGIHDLAKTESWYDPGTVVKMARVMGIGFPDKDWVPVP